LKISSSTDRAGRLRIPDLLPFAGIVALAGLVALALVALPVFTGLLPTAREAFQSQTQNDRGNAYRAVLDSRLAELGRWMKAAGTAPVVRDALTSGDPDAIRAAGGMLDSVLDFAERVEVYRPNTAVLDLEAKVPISYAALDIVRRAQAGRLTGPEAIEGDRRAIYIAQPVMTGDAVAGVVFVVVSPHYFLDPLNAFDPMAGRITVEQAFDDVDHIQVLTWGESDSDLPAAEYPLVVPHWKLSYVPGSVPAPEALSGGAITYGLLAALAALAIGIVLGFMRLAGTLRHDTELLRRRLQGDRSAGAFRFVRFEGIVDGMPVAPPEAADAAVSAAAVAAPVVATLESEAQGALAQSTPDSSVVRAAAANGAGHAAHSTPAPVDEGPAGATDSAAAHLDPDIFRAYDIRGIAGRTLTEDAAYWIGRAFAAEARAADQAEVAVGRDGRHSSPALCAAVVHGLTEGGIDVVDIGEVPTPMLYFATHALETGSGIMVTGSHNPPEYNGLKMVIAGAALVEARIQGLRRRIERNDLPEGAGRVRSVDLREAYLERIVSDVVVAQPLRVVVDCGNGVAGMIAPELVRRLDCDVVPLYCDVDPDFPNHHPDPAEPANLEDLVTVVRAEHANIGLAFDGDGDRLGVVTDTGRIIWPDMLMMLFAEDIVGRNPGADIVYDVKCSRHLNAVISELGGRPIMWKTGHSNIKAKLRETGALLAGEFSGHLCFGERWYGFDDALYAAARLLEILGAADEPVDAVFSRFPHTVGTPELKISTTDRAKFAIIERLAREADFGDGTLTTIDGVRVDYADGWGLVRPSNTSPVLTLRFEADDAAALERIQAIFATELARIDPDLRFR
jgi:phosphomannomutase/phosphoglucomutase